MTAINATDDLYAALGLSRTDETVKKNSDMGLEDFLELMVTQMTNQNPMEPMENGEFLGQIAQFGTVSGLNDLNSKFDAFSSSLTSGQALQAASLVGREIQLASNAAYLDLGGSVRGELALDSSATDVVIRVTNTVGQLVRELHLGPQAAGQVGFTWDGIDDHGDFARAGLYGVEAEVVRGVQSEALEPSIYSRVESVSLGSGGTAMVLNLRGLGSVPFSQVTEIH